jgi:Na+/serine symporter
MAKIGLAAGLATGALILVEVANGWYGLAAMSAAASLAAGFLIWALHNARG